MVVLVSRASDACLCMRVATVPKSLLDISDAEYLMGVRVFGPLVSNSSVLSLDMYDCCVRCELSRAVHIVGKGMLPG